MDELQELKRRMKEERPVEWDSFPDLGLYMDQVLSYMPRQLIHLGETDTLTSAMVNNYIKEGLLPRADGKKYSRTHLAYLTAICALKQVISVKEAHKLIQAGVQYGLTAEGLPTDHPTPEEKVQSLRHIYDYFCRELDQALSETADALPDEVDENSLPKVALGLALRSYADQLACQRVLALLAQREEPKKKRGSDKDKERA